MSAATMLLRLQGPMQSWGTTSRFGERDTQLEPSKSCVLGLICAALGRDRSEHVADLAALRMGVRVDMEGVPMRDYQTATGVRTAEGKVERDRTVLSPRFYLSDAVFLVGLAGERALLECIHLALQQPVWPLALGRKRFAPSMPPYLPDAVIEQDLETALKTWPYLARGNVPKQGLRLVVEAEREGAVRLDQPVAPFSERRFGPRFVKTMVLQLEAGHVSDPFAT